MFIENYRLDTMVGGQAQTTVIPYPKISHEDWLKWKAFLPVKSVPFCKKVLLGTRETFLQAAYGIPPDVSREMVRGAGYFKEIEDRKSTRLNSSHRSLSRMPSSA